MSWQVWIEEEVHRRYPGAGVWVTRISRQPSWVTRTAVLLAVLVVVIPVLLLTLAAVLVGVVALIVLGGIARLLNTVANLPGGNRKKDDGRRNVRVIRRP
ncbi:MAG: hypothetical protein Kow00105_06430 [Phycisphaeraceae bacterium]